MARLSNLNRPGDSPDNPVIECRLAARHEIEKGLRLILANSSGPASDEMVLDFLSLAVHRHIDVNNTWVAVVDGRIVWALLPIMSPGGSMLLLSPHRLFSQTPPQAIRWLAETVCLEAPRGMVLAQLLIDPSDRPLRCAYVDCGFDELAELIYLQRSRLHAQPMPQLPAGFVLESYAQTPPDRFAQTIEQSYQGSLDCPGLNGLRAIEDVIAGHKASGIFDPSMWFLLSEREKGRGILLLNPTAHEWTVELVYLGLVPEGRGIGLGDLLMQVALWAVAERGFTQLSLAVDSRNAPALKLYYRFGMRRVGSRIALIRTIEREGVLQDQA